MSCHSCPLRKKRQSECRGSSSKRFLDIVGIHDDYMYEYIYIYLHAGLCNMSLFRGVVRFRRFFHDVLSNPPWFRAVYKRGRFAKSLGHQDNQLSEISAVLLSPALRSIKLATGLKLLKFQPGCLGFGDDIPYPMWGL